MLSNKKIIELFNRLKSRKNAWLAMCPVGGTNYILVYY